MEIQAIKCCKFTVQLLFHDPGLSLFLLQIPNLYNLNDQSSNHSSLYLYPYLKCFLFFLLLKMTPTTMSLQNTVIGTSAARKIHYFHSQIIKISLCYFRKIVGRVQNVVRSWNTVLLLVKMGSFTRLFIITPLSF